MTSPVYWHPFLYQFLMRILYGRGFRDRYAALAEHIPNGSSVLELCAGDCMLYRRFLIGKGISYLGSDINPVFIAAARRKGIPMTRIDVVNDPIPAADILLMQASLYQFMPNHKTIVDKMLASALKLVIIAEPVKNLSDSKNMLVAFIARRSADPGTGGKPARFDRASFADFIDENYRDKIGECQTIAGGREILAVLDLNGKST